MERIQRPRSPEAREEILTKAKAVYTSSLAMLDRINREKEEVDDTLPKAPSDMRTVFRLVLNAENALSNYTRLQKRLGIREVIFLQERYKDLYQLGILASDEWRDTPTGQVQVKLWIAKNDYLNKRLKRWDRLIASRGIKK